MYFKRRILHAFVELKKEKYKNFYKHVLSMIMNIIKLIKVAYNLVNFIYICNTK